jgi:integrase
VSTSLQDAFAEYHRVRLAHLAAGPHIASMLERDLLRVLGARPVAGVTRRDIALVLDEVEARGSPIAANRLLQYIKAMFNVLVERELVPASPAAALRKRARERTRDRVLSEGEIRAVWAVGDSFTRLLLLTGLRRGELAGARRQHLRDGVLTVRAKGGGDHRITLSRQALVLVPWEDGLLFPGRGGCLRSGWSKRLRALHRWSGTAGWCWHDLRRTCATGMAAQGIDPVVIELCLGHVPAGVLGRMGAVYIRHSFEGRCAEAWQRWADAVRRLVADAPADGASFGAA